MWQPGIKIIRETEGNLKEQSFKNKVKKNRKSRKEAKKSKRRNRKKR